MQFVVATLLLDKLKTLAIAIIRVAINDIWLKQLERIEVGLYNIL